MDKSNIINKSEPISILTPALFVIFNRNEEILNEIAQRYASIATININTPLDQDNLSQQKNTDNKEYLIWLFSKVELWNPDKRWYHCYPKSTRVWILPEFNLQQDSNYSLQNIIMLYKTNSQNFISKLETIFRIGFSLNPILKENFSYRLQLDFSNKELLRYQKLAEIGKMVAGLCHEIRNLSNPIGLIEMINIDNPHDKELAKQIKQSQEDIVSLGQDILDSCKGKIPKQQNEQINIINLVNRSIRYAKLDKRIRKTKIECNFKFQGDVNVNRLKIMRVLFNLIQNATYAIKDKNDGYIIIKTTDKLCNAWIHVIDNGCGIDITKKDTIWEDFYTTKKDKGFGLGLSQIKQIINEYQGEINYKSTLNKGSEFIFSVPKIL